MDERIHIDTVIPADMSGKRFDQALSSMLPEYSRVKIQTWIRDGCVKIDTKSIYACDSHIQGGERVEICAEIKPQVAVEAENIPLQIIFEDEQFIIINKPAGLVVHPGAGNKQHTLMHALLYYDPKLRQVPRAGIVHRLDKETTGLLMVARTPQSHQYLVQKLQQREIKRQYVALVSGVMISGGMVNQAIGRHPKHRTKMAVLSNGRPAKTHYRIVKKYRHHTQIRVHLETGRTHQIRVHMHWLRYPILGDPMYGPKVRAKKGMSAQLVQAIATLPRQALHAQAISLVDPHSQAMLEWEAPIPEDMLQLTQALEIDTKQDNV